MVLLSGVVFVAIAEDASSPAAVNVTGTANMTTASFTPPAASLVLAIAGLHGAASGTSSATVSSSPSLVWNTAASIASSATNGASYIWYAWVFTSAAMTVTATVTNNTAGAQLTVKVLTGASSAQNGASGSSNVTSGTSFEVTLALKYRDSFPYGMYVCSSGNQNLTLDANTLAIDNYSDATDTKRSESFKASAATGTPSSTTFGGTLMSTASGSVAWYEVVPFYTVTQRTEIVDQIIGTSSPGQSILRSAVR